MEQLSKLNKTKPHYTSSFKFLLKIRTLDEVAGPLPKTPVLPGSSQTFLAATKKMTDGEKRGC